LKGEVVRKKSDLKSLGKNIALCLFAIFFLFQSCQKEQIPAEQPESLGISASDGAPSWSPDGRKIAFVSDRDGNEEIYLMNADGSDPTRLTHNPGVDRRPFWSPDGGKIAFVSERDGNREIYIMNADGSDSTRLTHSPGRDQALSWSPDGSKIAYISDRDGNEEIYMMNTDGSSQTRLTNNSARDLRPSWSPDSQNIIFSSNRDGNWETYTVNINSFSPVNLTDNPASDEEPSWSPDGNKIIFSSDRDFDGEIYVMDADGSHQTNLTNNAPVNNAFGLTPLPGGEINLDVIPYKIVFESFRETDGKENWELCMINANGSNLVNLTHTPDIDEMYPQTSPDGRQICFEVVEGRSLESKSRNVYVMSIDGTGRKKIAENANQPCWSPDGKRIAYLPGEFPRYNPSLFANRGLEIYDLTTHQARRHPNQDIWHMYNPCWSPDGQWLVAAGVSGPRRSSAFKVEDNTLIRPLFTGCRPDFSPDGKLLIWNQSDFAFRIGDIDFNSPDRNLTNHRIVVACDREHWVYHADWSPDGNFLAFSYAPGDGHENVGNKAPGSNICICDLNTGKWTQVTTDGKHNKEPDWVPSGAHRIK
jgi:Tol biopolymer transport system component